MALKKFNKEWVGVSFKHCGRDKNGVDCFGLLLQFLKQKGIEVPDPEYPEHWAKSGGDNFSEWLENVADLFERVNIPQVGDIAMFYGVNNVITHTGIMSSPTKFIHSVGKAGVCVSPLSGRFKRSLYGFFRIK